MRRFVFASLVLVACYSTDKTGDDDDDGASGAGGTTAQGGSAGSGGTNAGAAGNAGSSSGEAGAAAGGTSGTSSGAGGATGEAGAGNAGEGTTTGGTDGAGTAGSSGSAGEGSAGEGSAGEGSAGNSTGGSAGNPTGGSAGSGGTGGSAGGSGEAPTVAVLLDGSSSMFEPRELLWDALHVALMEPTNGVIPAFDQELRLGFHVFRGSAMPHEESDSQCASLASVSYAIDNAEAIGEIYDALSTDYVVGVKWETPTAHAINRVANALAVESVPDGSEKYIVLITDGNPNTCRTLDPQCGQDLVVKAVQDAHALGIRTLVFGLGDVLSPNAGCDPSLMPCGPVHLQDLANAGLGLPVASPPPYYYLTPCVVDGVLTATYSSAGGSATIYTATTVDEMRAAIGSMLERIASGAVP